MNVSDRATLGLSPPIFGNKVEGQRYYPRPGAYAVIFNEQGCVALIRTRTGYFLPGGGAEPHEKPEETLQREIYEECGYRVTVGHKLGEAIEYIFAQQEETYYEIQSVFFEARFREHIKQPVEDDHQLVWCNLAEGMQGLVRESQIWAIEQAGRRSRLK